jgi:hypothetical protein
VDNPGHSLYRQTVRKTFTFSNRGIKVVKARGVATLDLARNGRNVDRIYLYAVKRAEIWVFVEGDESKAHVRRFLEGTAAGNFRVKQLASNDGLASVANALMAIASGNATAKQRSLITNTDKDLWTHLEWVRAQPTLRYTKNGWLASLKRGVLFFNYDQISIWDGKTHTDPTQWIIYVEKNGNQWRIYDHGSYPRTESFLK